MKRLLTSLLLAAAACTVSAQGRIETFTIQSDILGCEKSCSVYLPEGYDNSTNDYPVLYLLHRAGGHRGDGAEEGSMATIAGKAIATGRALPVVVVMPDESGTGHN